MTELKNIYKSFGEQKVLKGFSLSLPEGSRTAIMGRSGAGKTTALNILMGLMKPDSGEVIVLPGTKFGAVFQEDRLIEPLSAAANCRIVMKKSGGEYELLERLGITRELADKPSGELSGGEKRRVALARAILCAPDLFVFDEPFKGIDEKTLPKVIAEANKAVAGKTLLLVTHSREEAAALSCEVREI